MCIAIVKYIKKIKLKFRFPTSIFYSNVQIDSSSFVGNNSVLFNNTTLISSHLGDYSYVQKFSNIYNTKIGPFCSIASNVNIGLANHPTNFISTSPVFYDNTQPLPDFFVNLPSTLNVLPRTNIEADVWVGQSVLIKAGLNIGVGSVIGAGSMVTKDIPPYTIVGGVPAKVIKKRFTEDIISQLIKSKWWEVEPKKLKTLSNTFNDPLLFIEKLKCLK